MRLARRETFRDAVFLCTMPFWAARIISGSAGGRGAAARGAEPPRLGGAPGGRGLGLIPGSDRLFNLADEGPHPAATRLVDRGALRDLAGHLLGGHGVGHGPS